jgi:hypothetical protein
VCALRQIGGLPQPSPGARTTPRRTSIGGASFCMPRNRKWPLMH